MSWISDVADELRELVAEAWPETDDNRMPGKSAAMFNWRELISAQEDGETDPEIPTLEAPFAVIELSGGTPNLGYGDGNDVYDIGIQFIYVISWKASETEVHTAEEAEAILLERFEALRSKLSEDATTFQIVAPVTFDASAKSATNQFFLKRNNLFIGLEVNAVAIAGVSSEP